MKYTGISETGNIQKYQRQEIYRNIRDRKYPEIPGNRKFTEIPETGNIQVY